VTFNRDPAVQAFPHAPQFIVVVVAVSQPSVADVLQLPNPAAHIPMPQVLAVHVAVITLGRLHCVPHMPQLAGVARLVSHPLVTLLSQLAKPALHAMPHALAAHVAVAFAGVGHIIPHVPQLAVSVASVRHTPAQHVCPALHTRPHAPQFCSSP
jgi:hypothetical protein